MIVNFRCSFYLQKEIFGNLYNFKKLKKFISKFERYFKEYKNVIMKNIEKYSGYEWNINLFIVWIFDGYYPSISFPLLLNWYGGDKEFALFTLIHELVHNNLFSKLPIRKGEKIDKEHLEAFEEIITKNVAKKIFNEKKLKTLCKKAEFEGTYRYIWERVGTLEKRWDLEKGPIKSFIRENYI